MPFRSSRVQSRLLTTTDDETHDLSLPTRPSMDRTYLDLPSPLSKASEEPNPFSPTSPGSPLSPFSPTGPIDATSPGSHTSHTSQTSPTSPLSPASTRVGVGSGPSPVSVSRYLPGKAKAWWKTSNAGENGNGDEVYGERGVEGDDIDGVLSDSMVGGNAIGGTRQARKKRISGVVEMVGMVFVVLTLVGFVVACLGWMHAGSHEGGELKNGKEILGKRDIFERQWWYGDEV